MRRSRQSELLGVTDRGFLPPTKLVRVSFLDLAEGPAGCEPAYVDGSTMIAVWPSYGDLAQVEVVAWSPDRDTLRALHELQVDWPPDSCDLQVRLQANGRVFLQPCRRCYAAQAWRSSTELGRAVRHALERGAQLVGRPLALAA